MFSTIFLSNRELGPNLYGSVNNASNFLDSLLLCISYRLSLHIIGRNFITQFSESQSISMFNRICCRIIEENHIIAIRYIDRAIFVGSNIAGDNVHTIIFRTPTSFNRSITDRATALVCVHINTLICLISRHINLILSIICHTLVTSRRQLVVIDSLVELVVLPSQGLNLIIIHSRQLLLGDIHQSGKSLHLVFMLQLNVVFVCIISIVTLRVSIINILLMLLLRSCWLVCNLSSVHFGSLGNIVATHLHQVDTIVNGSINLILAHGVSLSENISQHTTHLLVVRVINLILDVCPLIANQVLSITISHVHLVTESVVLSTIVHTFDWSGASTHRIHRADR